MIPKLKDRAIRKIFTGNGNLGVSAVLRDESNSCDDSDFARALSATEQGEINRKMTSRRQERLRGTEVSLAWLASFGLA